jgi:cytochrome c oxidase cbb3-type subunit 3
MFYITVVFSLVYLALYPGLGNMAGQLRLDVHAGQYDGEMKKADEQYGPIFKKFQARTSEPWRPTAKPRKWASACS